MRFISVLTIVLESFLLLGYDLPVYCIIFFILTVLELIIVDIRKIKFSVAGWWLCIYIICSFLIISTFKFTPSKFTRGGRSLTIEAFDSLAEVSFVVVFVFFLSVLLLYRNNKVKVETKWTNYAPNFSLSFVFIVGFLLTLLSYIIGIGKMGVENTSLPFHLSGIIQFCRTDLIPVLVLCLYVNRKNKGKSVLIVLVLLFGWSLFETVVRLSKSAILFSFLPIIMYELLSSKKNILKTIKPFIPIALVVLLLYPVIEVLRSSDSATLADSEDEISGTFENPETPNFFVKPFNRSFLTGYLFCIDRTAINDNTLFDFSQAPFVIIAGGAPKYQTFIIDGYPEGVNHSSGTTPFIDSFLMGGYGLLYISIVVMVFFAEFIDKKFRSKSNYVIVAILCVAFYRLFDMPLFSFFVNEMSVRYIIVYCGICLFIIFSWKRTKNNIIQS